MTNWFRGILLPALSAVEKKARERELNARLDEIAKGIWERGEPVRGKAILRLHADLVELTRGMDDPASWIEGAIQRRIQELTYDRDRKINLRIASKCAGFRIVRGVHADACPPVLILSEKLYTADDYPRVPLTGCNAETCQCRVTPVLR
jgi:hypothetical protein